MQVKDVVAKIIKALADKPNIRALFLSGSHGNGRADAYSDIDFILVSAEGATNNVAALWLDAIRLTGEIVLLRDRTVRPSLINAITADWTRTDVLILKPGQMDGHTQANLKSIFDHDGIFETLPREPPPGYLNPARLRYQVEEFIRIFGLLYLVVGRKEYINGVTGVFHLRNMLVDLLVDETSAPDRGGALHLNRLLNEEQRQLMSALPPPIAEKEAIIATHLAYAIAYLPRARRLAIAWGVEWPEQLEAATWTKLYESLGIVRSY
jgi:predicted nucleotidyltransferase